MIKVGQTVTWTSQAGGHSKTKTGRVLAIITTDAFGLKANAFYVLSDALKGRHINMSMISSNQIKFQHISQLDRVLVEVPRKSGVMDYYAPRLQTIERQNGEGVTALLQDVYRAGKRVTEIEERG